MSKKRQLAVTKVEVPITETALKNEVRDATTSTSAEVKSKQVNRIANFLQDLPDEELMRFEFYVRSHLTRNRVKDVMKEALSVKEIDDEMAIIVGGLTKLFIGELCDHAVDVIGETGEAGNIQPDHIREAYRRLHRDGSITLQPDTFHPFTETSKTRVVSMDDLLS